MQATRQRILEFLDQRGRASTRQLAQAFGMTAANMRRHLAILEARGLVQPAELRASGGRGRPVQFYSLAPAQRDPAIEKLADALLHDLAASPAKLARLRRLADRLIGERSPVKGQTTQRLVSAVNRLTPMGYRPRWEARPQGPQVVLGRCPFAAIIADHPELCQMDQLVLSDLLAAPVEQTAKLLAGPQGLPQCVFRMHTSG